MGYGTFKFITVLSYTAIIILSFIAMFSSFGNIYNATFFKRNDTIIDNIIMRILLLVKVISLIFNSAIIPLTTIYMV